MLQQGWTALTQNKMSEAQKAFESCLQDAETKEQAYLSLALLYQSINKPQEAFNAFQQFFRISKNPYPALYAVWTSDLSGRSLPEKQLPFIQEILARPDVDGTIKAMCYGQLGDYYEEKAEFEKAKKYYQQIGAIQKWQLIGSFENVSASGFDKDFGVLAQPEPTASFTNKYGAPIKWYDCNAPRNDQWLDFDFHFAAKNGIQYAQTFCTAPTAMDVQLRLGTSGSVKVWLNDQLIINDAEETNNDLDTYIQNVRLNTGNNRILIQLGASEITRCNFLCRLTNAQGEPLTNLQFSNTYAPYTKTTNAATSTVDSRYEAYFNEKIQAEPNTLLNYLLLTNTLLHNDKAYQASHTLKQAELLAPNYTYLLSLKGENYVRDANYSGLSSVLKKMKEVDSLSYSALNLEYNELIDKEDYDNAEKIATAIQERYGDDASAMAKRIQIYSKTKQIEKLFEAIEEGYQKYPSSVEYAYLKFVVESQVKKNSKKAIQFLSSHLKVHYSDKLMEDLINYYLTIGKPVNAIALLEKTLTVKPYAVGYLNTLSTVYYGSGDVKKSLGYNAKACAMAPYIGTYHGTRGDLYDRLGEKEKAIEGYTEAIKYDPTDYDSREKIRQLSDRSDLFTAFEKPDFKALFQNAPDASQYPEDNSVLLADNVQKIVYKGGAAQEKHFLMVKVFNASGIDTWKEYNIGYADADRLLVEDAYIIKKNGTKVDADQNDSQIIYTGLEVGDAICLSWKLDSYLTGKIAENFSDYFYFNSFYPSRRSVYQLLIDTSVHFQYKVSNTSDIQPEIHPLDEFKLYTWVNEKVPALKYERAMPTLSDVAKVLCISSYPSWDYVASWYGDLANRKANADFEVKELVKELFKDKQNLSELAKAHIIYEYITKDIRYSSVSFRQSGLIPQRPANVINSKIGDCKDVSTLFVTMCKEVGIDANLVLVRTRDKGEDFFSLPSLEFNHCIAGAELDGKKYYIELTSDYFPFSCYSSDIHLAKGLEIFDKNSNKHSALIPLTTTSRSRNTVDRRTTVTLKENTIIVTKDNVKTGYLAASMRRNYRDIGKVQQNKEMQEAITDEFPIIHLDSLHFDHTLNTASDSVNYYFSYTAENPMTSIGSIQLLKIPFSDATGQFDFLSGNDRVHPLLLWEYFRQDYEREVMTIHLPAGKKLLEIPKSASISNDYFDYSIQYKLVKNTLEATRTLKIKSFEDIDPSQFESIKKQLEQLIKYDSMQLAFQS